MNMPLDRRADAFSDWLETHVAGALTPDYDSTADPELRTLFAAADRFHRLSETWTQEVMVYSPPVTTWEDLMTRRSGSLIGQPSILVSSDRAGTQPGRWETWNRFAFGVLVAAVIIAIGAGVWRVAGDREFGAGTELSPTTGLFGLQPTDDDSAMATPDHTVEPEQSVPATTPVDQLPGIESAVFRDYSASSDRPPGIPDMGAIGVSVYRFDSPDNASASYDLLVSNFIKEFADVQTNNVGYTPVAVGLSGPGERSNLVRLDFADASGYQS